MLKKAVCSKGRKRLSSLFSSSSLSSHLADKDGSAEPPSRRSSNLNVSSTSTSTTGEVTPPIGAASGSRKYPGLGLGTDEKHADDVTAGVGRLGIGSVNSPLVESPTLSHPPTTVLTAEPSHIVPDEQLYGQWVGSDEDTSDEELSFRTPDEGLSEVEEDDEDEEGKERGQLLGGQQAAAAAAPVPAQSSPSKGTKEPEIDSQDVLGTGPSTVKRTKTGNKTQVVRNLHASKESALSMDQAKILAPDLDACRQILTLFLTSRMREAEEQCREGDPEGNRLYMLSAGGIIQALKVCFPCGIDKEGGSETDLTGNDDV